jgi:hypothetical protein
VIFPRTWSSFNSFRPAPAKLLHIFAWSNTCLVRVDTDVGNLPYQYSYFRQPSSPPLVVNMSVCAAEKLQHREVGEDEEYVVARRDRRLHSHW